MASNDNEQYLLNQQVSFLQHFLPGLDAGDYKLEVQQRIADSGHTPVPGASYASQYTFSVRADRFAFANPGNIVASVFPADTASGEFSNVLPHVVFLPETFPWVRYPTDKVPYTPPQPGTDTDADVPTWLWVMLLDEDDVAAHAQLDLQPATRKVADLFPSSALPAGVTSSLGDNHSYFEGATDTHGLEPSQGLDDTIQTIDVPLDLFWQLAPTIEDLKQMAHGRVVSLINQTTVATRPNPGEPVGAFSVVFGNRLPATNRKTVAYLVSLEGLERFLPQVDAGGAPSGTPFVGTQALRLAVLHSWSFFSTGQPATFVHQLLRLNGRVIDDPNFPNPPPAANTNLRVPYAGPNPVLRSAFNMGYVPLNQMMRTAEKNVSWYRGPLAPYVVAPSTLPLPVTSPDAATVFDPTTGLLDVSYAAAWTIGRMVALQDTGFSTAWYAWKQSLQAQVATAVEKNLVERTLGQALGHAAPKLLAADAKPVESLLKRTLLALSPDA